MIDNHLYIESVESEIAEVNALLESIPTDHLIDRKSLEGRLEYLQAALARARQSAEKPKDVRPPETSPQPRTGEP